MLIPTTDFMSVKKILISVLAVSLFAAAAAGCGKKKDDRLSGPYDVSSNKEPYVDEIDMGADNDNGVTIDDDTGSVISTPNKNNSKAESGKEQVGEDDLPSKTTDSKSSSSAGSSSSDKSNSSSSSSSSSSGKDNSSSSSSDDNKQSMDGWEPWR